MREIFLQCFTCLVFLVFTPPSDLHGRTITDFTKNDFYPVLTDTILNLDDTLRFDLVDCASTAEVCIGIPIGDISEYQITTNGQAYTNGIAGCDNDTTNIYSYLSLFGQGQASGGPYILELWEINGSLFSIPFADINELVDSMNAFDPTGNWMLNEVDLVITGGTPGFTYSDLEIRILQTGFLNIIGQNVNFIPQGTLLSINSGVTELIVTESLTGASDTAIIIAGCSQLDTISQTIFVGSSGTHCLDFSELPGDFNSVTNICPSVEIDFQTVNADSCIVFTGMAMGSDTACIVACDDFGFCDTTYLFITALQEMGTQEIFDTIFVGQADQWCADLSIFMGTPDSIYNICLPNSGTFAGFTIDETSFCVDYSGLSGLGTDQGCFVVCDDLNNCDTTIINVTVRETGMDYYFDTLYINQEDFFCDWDTTNLFGPIVNIENGCLGSSGSEVFFDLDITNFCLTYEGIAVGKDTACIYVTDNTGNIDTTMAIVCILQPESDIITDSIRLTTMPVYCIDTTQLGGDIVSIENICPGDSGESINFEIDSTTFCVQANPILIGTDSLCIVICDEFGICDTTTFIVTVEDDMMMTPPQANDDIDSTAQNNSIIVDACFNDSIPANLDVTNFFVLPVASGGVGPSNGTAFSNNDNCTVSYIPNDDFCGNDQITYVICNMMGCDTATITVTVVCPSSEFEVFDAFSPNGDGVNEFFRINGIEQFPDHTLWVFNRWGNEVLKVNNYQNDWNGRWQGLDLPDGTYFYVFDTGEGTVDSGYVYIGR